MEVIVFAVLQVVIDGLPIIFNDKVFVAKCVFVIFVDLFFAYNLLILAVVVVSIAEAASSLFWRV